MSSIDPAAVKDLMSFISLFPIDKVLHEVIETPLTHSVGGAPDLGGGFYGPKTDILTVANPVGKKCFMSMVWSIDGVNYYNAKQFLYNPSNNPSKAKATVGWAVDNNFLYFYFTHYIPTTVNFSIKYVLDNIL